MLSIVNRVGLKIIENYLGLKLIKLRKLKT
nr:MAG TPA: hypothetical protein [Caudoviricetes sp.]